MNSLVPRRVRAIFKSFRVYVTLLSFIDYDRLCSSSSSQSRHLQKSKGIGEPERQREREIEKWKRKKRENFH